MRAQIVREHGQSVADQPGPPRREPREDPLGAAIHARHRAAARAAPAAPRPPAAAVAALSDRLLARLAEAGPAQRRALKRLAARTLEPFARSLPRHPPPSAAQPQGP